MNDGSLRSEESSGTTQLSAGSTTPKNLGFIVKLIVGLVVLLAVALLLIGVAYGIVKSGERVGMSPRSESVQNISSTTPPFPRQEGVIKMTHEWQEIKMPPGHHFTAQFTSAAKCFVRINRDPNRVHEVEGGEDTLGNHLCCVEYKLDPNETRRCDVFYTFTPLPRE